MPNSVSRTTLYALAFALAVAAASLSACSKPEMPAAVAAIEPKSAPVVDVPGVEAASTVTCAEGDIECEERIYQLEETLFAYEAAVTKQVPEAAQACWKNDSNVFRENVDGCKNFACKESALLARIAGLHSLQPEDQRAALALPRTAISTFDPSQCKWVQELSRAAE